MQMSDEVKEVILNDTIEFEENEKIKKFFNNMYSAVRDLFKRLKHGNSIQLFLDRMIEMEIEQQTCSLSRIFRPHPYKKTVHFYSFAFNPIEQTGIYLRKYRSDILCGLYFPNHSVGDKITIRVNGVWLNTIYIINDDDLKKIHFPLKNDFMIPLISLGLTDIEIQTSYKQKPYYSIGLTIGDADLRNDFAKKQFMYKGINLFFQHYICHYISLDISDKYEKMYKDDIDSTLILDYNEIYAANLIKKMLKQYLIKKKKRDSICGEIRALPERGIDYKNAMKDFYNNVKL